MARLTRKNMKVFAANASNNGVFGSLEAGNPTVTNDVEQIQGLTAWGAGWNAATLTAEKLPPLEEFQGVQYVTTYQQAYLMQEGMPEWNANVTYYKGSLTKKVTTTGFQIYNSLTDDNTNHQLSDTANWKLVMDSDNLYAMDNAVVHIAGDETITGAKTFSQTGTDASIVQSTTLTTDGAYVDLIQNINNNRRGTLRTMYDADDDSYTVTLGCNGPNASSPSGINIKRTASEVTATAPKPTENNTTSTQIDTVGERNTKINAVLSALYPVGSLYITTNNSATCPLASLISGSTWSLVEAGRALWTANKDGNKTIAAGLPNITGRYNHRCLMNDNNGTEVGAFRTLNNSTDKATQYAAGSDSGNKRTISFDASRSSSIYGSSTTVQPPAFTVNVWRRTA